MLERTAGRLQYTAVAAVSTQRVWAAVALNTGLGAGDGSNPALRHATIFRSNDTHLPRVRSLKLDRRLTIWPCVTGGEPEARQGERADVGGTFLSYPRNIRREAMKTSSPKRFLENVPEKSQRRAGFFAGFLAFGPHPSSTLPVFPTQASQCKNITTTLTLLQNIKTTIMTISLGTSLAIGCTLLYAGGPSNGKCFASDNFRQSYVAGYSDDSARQRAVEGLSILSLAAQQHKQCLRITPMEISWRVVTRIPSTFPSSYNPSNLGVFERMSHVDPLLVFL